MLSATLAKQNDMSGDINNVDKEGEKIKMVLLDGGNLEEYAKETNKELNSKKMLSAIRAKQNSS